MNAAKVALAAGGVKKMDGPENGAGRILDSLTDAFRLSSIPSGF
ncbi:MAG TPA: hypothetical protein PKA51_11930 [Kiritimatiellia bacterium]|nr:hypothetical protein [Kiritimatiellia bacterium]